MLIVQLDVFSRLRSLWHAITVPVAPVVAHELVAVVVKLATVARESPVIVSVIEFICGSGCDSEV